MYLIQSHKEDEMILVEIKLGILGLIIIRWSVRPIVALARSLVFQFEVTFYPSF